MAIAKHRMSVLDGSSAAFTDKLIIGTLIGVANLIGGGAGQNVATVVAFAEPLPASFGVIISPRQDAVGFISAITTSGFTVNISPRLAANTLAAGTFDVLIYA
jgi:hypothetical protein